MSPSPGPDGRLWYLVSYFATTSGGGQVGGSGVVSMPRPISADSVDELTQALELANGVVNLVVMSVSPVEAPADPVTPRQAALDAVQSMLAAHPGFTHVVLTRSGNPRAVDVVLVSVTTYADGNREETTVLGNVSMNTPLARAWSTLCPAGARGFAVDAEANVVVTSPA